MNFTCSCRFQFPPPHSGSRCGLSIRFRQLVKSRPVSHLLSSHASILHHWGQLRTLKPPAQEAACVSEGRAVTRPSLEVIERLVPASGRFHPSGLRILETTSHLWESNPTNKMTGYRFVVKETVATSAYATITFTTGRRRNPAALLLGVTSSGPRTTRCS